MRQGDVDRAGGGGDGRGKCNCLSMFPGHFLSILLMTILGDPGAVSRVDKMFVVKVYCKIETSSSRSYSKLSPRTFYRPD